MSAGGCVPPEAGWVGQRGQCADPFERVLQAQMLGEEMIRAKEFVAENQMNF